MTPQNMLYAAAGIMAVYWLVSQAGNLKTLIPALPKPAEPEKPSPSDSMLDRMRSILAAHEKAVCQAEKDALNAALLAVVNDFAKPAEVQSEQK